MPRICLFLLVLFFLSGTVAAQHDGIAGSSVGRGSLWLGAVAGPSLLLEKAPDSLMIEIQDYLNKLRSGWHYGFETQYFFNNYIGLGAKYSRFNTRQEVDSLVLEFFSKIYYIDLSSNMSIHSLAPMAYGRFPMFGNKLSITAGIGPAWLFYRNLGKAVEDTAMFKGSSPGLSTSLRVNYEIFPNLSIGLQGSYIHALLKEFTQDDGSSQQTVKLEEENYQNISHIDLSFGIYYTFRRK